MKKLKVTGSLKKESLKSSSKSSKLEETKGPANQEKVKKPQPKSSNSNLDEVGKTYQKYKLPKDSEYFSQIKEELYYLPKDITEIPYERLGIFMSHLVEYSSWLSRSIAYLTVNVRNAEELKKDREAVIIRHLRSNGRRNVEMLMRQDSEWKNLHTYTVKMNNEITILAAEVAALERRLATVSREQSRRESLLKKKILEI